MARFLEFEIDLISKVNDELALTKNPIPDIVAKITIDLDMVMAYRQACGDDEDDSLGENTMLYMCDGTSFHINYKYEQFDELRRRYKGFT